MDENIYIECPLKECQFTITDSVNYQPAKLIYVKPISIDELVKGKAIAFKKYCDENNIDTDSAKYCYDWYYTQFTNKQ